MLNRLEEILLRLRSTTTERKPSDRYQPTAARMTKPTITASTVSCTTIYVTTATKMAIATTAFRTFSRPTLPNVIIS